MLRGRERGEREGREKGRNNNYVYLSGLGKG